MKPNISEFSYGYALTEDLIRWVGTPITAAPVFPSLLEEGKLGGGYDLKLDFSGIPLFIQFKLSNYMKNRNTIEFEERLFSSPYYRMHVRSSRYSLQHELLLDLEKNGSEVYYAAPAFHEAGELNDAYINKAVLERSIFIRPSAIGLLDNKEHHVAFQLSGSAYLLSRNPKLITVLTNHMFERHIVELPQKDFDHNQVFFNDLGRTMMQIVRRYFKSRDLINVDLNAISDLQPIQRISYLSRFLFGCEMFMIRNK